MRKICFAALLVPALAWAQPRTAEQWYNEGENQYTLGNFDKAVDAFKQGFSLETADSKKAAYLYNIAQSYRQANDCKNAKFFYERFLALKNEDTLKPLSAKVRKDVQDRIDELEVCVQQTTTISKKPPTTTLAPGGEIGDRTTPPRGDDAHKAPAVDVAVRGDASPDGDAGDAGDDGDEDDGGAGAVAPGTPPRLISARITGGGTKLTTGDFNVPVQATLAVVGGYPIPVADRLTIEAGAAFTYTPVPFEMGMESKSAHLIGLMANAGVSYEVIPKLAVRGDLGLGALFFGGVSESVFTGGAATSGALTMFHLRTAVSADYAFTPNIVGTVTPVAFTFSPAKQGLREDITSITSFDFMLGIGYRM